MQELKDIDTIAVDFDGTLSPVDLLFEGFSQLIRKNPLYLLACPFWALSGIANLKHQIALRTEIDLSLIPYHKEVLWFLRQQKGLGMRIVLATAANQKIAGAVSKHLEVFDAVYASTATLNLKSRNKRQTLIENGNGNMVYLGDSFADFAVWGGEIKAIPVGSKAFCSRVEEKFDTLGKSFLYEASLFKSCIKALRPHQWAKNFLLFVPLLLTPALRSLDSFASVLLGILSFSLCASSVYLLNDLFDLEADRATESKSTRPFASGKLPIKWGLIMIPCLLGLAIFSASQLSTNFSLVLGLYYFITCVYSFWLKSQVLLDVITLSVLYTARIFAGGAVIGATISPWLIAFSMFFFFSLALVKRYVELAKLRSRNLPNSKAAGRGYQLADSQLLGQLGISTGLISVLVLSLYINSEPVQATFQHPGGLWLSSLFLLYWICRVWILTYRNQMHEDPVLFAVKDQSSYINMLLISLVFWYCQ